VCLCAAVSFLTEVSLMAYSLPISFTQQENRNVCTTYGIRYNLS
jgi:hypothetical protein